MSRPLIPVVLSGGSGTRLWPLSTPEQPKQFLPLLSEKSLFQETLLRLDGLADIADPIIVCNETHRELVAKQLAEIDVDARAIILEPAGRNTAPAIGVAAAVAIAAESVTKQRSDPILLVFPSDHVIGDRGAFEVAITRAVRAADAGRLVTFGVVPTGPETGYGYIERGDDLGDSLTVERFVEKPDLRTARRYLESGRFLWNSGMFVFGAATYLNELDRFAPAIHEACQSAVVGSYADGAFTRLGPEFLASPSNSVDYAVMERTDRAAVVPLEAGWNDVGSWAALHDVLNKDANGNVLPADALALDARNCLVVSGMRRIAILGLEDVVVIDSGEYLLITKKDHSQSVKLLCEQIDSD